MAVDRCRQTLLILERALDGDATERDRAHARGCTTCTRALYGLPAFERDLEVATRSLAVKPLPVGVLVVTTSTGTSVRGWATRSVHALGLLAAAMVAVLVIVVGIRQVGRFEGGPGGSAAPMRSHGALVDAMAELGLSCRMTILGPAASPPVKGSLCVPAVPRSGVEVVGGIELDQAGQADALLVKTRVSPVAGEAGRKRVDDLLLDMAGIAFPERSDAAAAAAWVRSALPAAGAAAQSISIGGLDVSLEVPAADQYLLHVEVPKN